MLKQKKIMKHFDYYPLYKEIRKKQKQELKDALQKHPDHEFHFGMDYSDDKQKVNAEYPYIIGYLGEYPVDLKVLAVREKDGLLSLLVEYEEGGVEATIHDVDSDVVLGHLENVLDELPDM